MELKKNTARTRFRTLDINYLFESLQILKVHVLLAKCKRPLSFCT